MKHLKVRQKYSAVRRIFNSLLSVSSGDEMLCPILNIIFTRSSPSGAKKCQPTLRVRAQSSNRLLLRRS